MIRGLHYVVLMCSDTERSREWYEKAGFDHLRGHDGMHWFQLGDAEVMLHPAGGEVPTGTVKLHAAVGDVDAAFERIVAAGLTPRDHQQPGEKLQGPVTRPWGDREFELHDPDGHVWGLTETAGG